MTLVLLFLLRIALGIRNFHVLPYKCFSYFFSSSVKKIIEVLVLISLNHTALFITIIFTVFTLPTYNHGRFSISQCFCQCFHCRSPIFLVRFICGLLPKLL